MGAEDKREDQKFNVILSYIVSLRLVWTRPYFKTTKK